MVKASVSLHCEVIWDWCLTSVALVGWLPMGLELNLCARFLGNWLILLSVARGLFFSLTLHSTLEIIEIKREIVQVTCHADAL